jgi:hypothetical protein
MANPKRAERIEASLAVGLIRTRRNAWEMCGSFSDLRKRSPGKLKPVIHLADIPLRRSVCAQSRLTAKSK